MTKSPQTPSNEEKKNDGLAQRCPKCNGYDTFICKVHNTYTCRDCAYSGYDPNSETGESYCDLISPTKPDISELGKLLTIALGNLMIISEEYPNVGEIVAAIEPTIQTLISSKETEARIEEADWWNVQSGYLAKYLIDNRQNASALVQQEMADRISELTGGQIDE